MKKVCPICLKRFETPYKFKKYCSLKCKKKARSPKIHEKTCAHCGATFMTKTDQQKYCSKRCADLHFYQEHRRPRKVVKKICPTCGVEFETCNLRKRYCSKACSNRHQYTPRPKPTYIKTCAYCNGEFTTRDPKRLYCSTACQRSAEILNARLQREAKREAVRLAAQNKPAVVKPIETPAPSKVIIPAAVAENRKPTVDELLDWIFSKGATA